jgi:phosphatidylinositol alpha-1,6-mannosyltransferase
MSEIPCERRVLLSTQSLAPGNGGISVVARMTASVLLRRCHVEALACQDPMTHEIETLSVQAFADRRLPFFLANLAAIQRSTHVIYDFAGTARAHVHLPFWQRPYAVWVHGLEVWRKAPSKYLHAISGATLLLANSAYTVARANGLLPRKVEIVTVPLGTAQDALPAQIGPSDGPPTVLLLGRADELFAKGHDLLIEIWPTIVSAVPDARLVLVGGGSALKRVYALVAASPARSSIEITGFVPDDALDTYWRRAVVFAMLGFTEGFGLVYIEAMRRGLPVIASTEDAGQEVNVDGTTGFNIPRESKSRLIDVVVALLRDRDLARSLGAAGHRRWHEQYTFAAFGLRLTKAIDPFLTL